MDAAARIWPAPWPVLIDATLAGLVSGAPSEPLVIPCLNRDGDLLSDLVLPLFGSIARRGIGRSASTPSSGPRR